MDSDSIKTLIQEEVGNVKSMMKDLLAKKLSYYDAQAANKKDNLPKFPENKDVFSQLWPKLEQEFEDIALDIVVAPNNETVRKVKAFLVDVSKALPNLDEGNARRVLDVVYKLAPYTIISYVKPDKTTDRSVYDVNYGLIDKSTKGGKDGQARRAIVEYIFKFLSNASKEFLNKDNIYPRSLRDMIEDNDFNLEEIAKNVAKAMDEKQKTEVAEKPVEGKDAEQLDAEPIPDEEDILPPEEAEPDNSEEAKRIVRKFIATHEVDKTPLAPGYAMPKLLIAYFGFCLARNQNHLQRALKYFRTKLSNAQRYDELVNWYVQHYATDRASIIAVFDRLLKIAQKYLSIVYYSGLNKQPLAAVLKNIRPDGFPDLTAALPAMSKAELVEVAKEYITQYRKELSHSAAAGAGLRRKARK